MILHLQNSLCKILGALAATGALGGGFFGRSTFIPLRVGNKLLVVGF